MLCTRVLRSLPRPCVVSRLFCVACAGGLRVPALCLRGGSARPPLDAARPPLLRDNQRLLLLRGLTTVQNQNQNQDQIQDQDQDLRLIYSGPWGNYIRWFKVFSYSTSLLTMAVLPHIALSPGLGSGPGPGSVQVLVCVVSLFCAAVTPVLFHVLTRGYVLRLYHSRRRDSYSAVTISPLLTLKTTEFLQSEVTPAPPAHVFSSFTAGGLGMLVFPDGFHPHDYNHLMGYDKPFSFPPDDLQGPQ